MPFRLKQDTSVAEGNELGLDSPTTSLPRLSFFAGNSKKPVVPCVDIVDLDAEPVDKLRLIQKPKEGLATSASTTSIMPMSTVPKLDDPTSAPAPKTQSLFLDLLPSDLHYHILTNYLDFDSLLALRQTCSQLHTLLPPSLLSRLRSTIVTQFLADEHTQLRLYRAQYPRQPFGHLWDLFYAAFEWQLMERPAKELRCYGCLQTKPLWCFVERMSTRGTGLAGKLAKNRMCKTCMRRYRRVGGVWWREHWVKKADTVRKAGRVERWRRWAVEGHSLLKVDEEIGVCVCCGTSSFELFWGCVGCFEKEEERRKAEDLEGLDGMGRRIIEGLYKWKGRRDLKERKKCARTARRRRWWRIHVGWRWEGSLEDRIEALGEWLHGGKWPEGMSPDVHSKSAHASQQNPNNTLTTEQPWRAVDQLPVTKDRREARCCMCWVPMSYKKTYMTGMAYENRWPRERWCDDCVREDEEKCEKQQQSKQQKKGVEEGKMLEGMRVLFGDLAVQSDDN